MNNTKPRKKTVGLRIVICQLGVAIFVMTLLFSCNAKPTQPGKETNKTTANPKSAAAQQVDYKHGNAHIRNSEIKEIADFLESYGMLLRKKDTATKL